MNTDLPFEDEEIEQHRMSWNSLSGAGKDTLAALVKRGPVWDGDLPSKTGRDELCESVLASRCLVNGRYGFQAATPHGANVYWCNSSWTPE